MASLEEIIAANTAAVVANTAALKAAGGAAGGTGRGPGRPAGSGAKKVDFDQVKVIAKKVMDEKGRPAAVKLIQAHGADQLANLEEAKYPAFVAAAEVLLAAAAEPEPTEADGEL